MGEPLRLMNKQLKQFLQPRCGLPAYLDQPGMAVDIFKEERLEFPFGGCKGMGHLKSTTALLNLQCIPAP